MLADDEAVARGEAAVGAPDGRAATDEAVDEPFLGLDGALADDDGVLDVCADQPAVRPDGGVRPDVRARLDDGPVGDGGRTPDDGAGLDPDALRRKAIEKDVLTEDEATDLSDSEAYQLIFRPGFSTTEEVGQVSGRGVGMDVVKTTVESLDGSVSVESEPGEGSTFNIRLPVSVAIIKVLFVQVEDREFGVPIKYIDEISRRDRVQTVNGAEVIVHEETIFPLIRLREALEIDSPEPDDGMVVRIRPDDRQVALHCDGVTKQEEVVVTPLQGPLSGVGGLSGTAVIGDGNVIPILDVSTLELPADGEQAMREFDPSQLGDTAEEAAD